VRLWLPALLLALLVAPGPAQALSAARHEWAWRALEAQAQVRDDLLVEGPGGDLELDLPAGSRGVQAFVDGRAAPWEWVAPHRLLVRTSALGDADATAQVLVLYVAPLPANGLLLERTLTLDTRELRVRAVLPEGWDAALDGRPLTDAPLGPLAAGSTLHLRLAPATGPSPLLVLAAMLLLVLAGTMARALTARGRAAPPAMGLLDHLRELTTRLRVMVLAVAVLTLVLFTVALRPVALGGMSLALPVPSLADNIAAQTFRLLSQQFVPPGVEVVVVDPVSAALVQVEVALFLAVVVAAPLLAYEAGAFLMPALLPRERRLLLRAIPAVTLLFVAGALFAYALMVPTMMRVLYSYAQGLGARSFLAVDSLVSFAIVVTLIFGLAFELPVGMVVLAKLGLVGPRAMARRWRHVTVGIFVVAAVITPDPSVVSQVLVAVPLLGLYAAGLVAARVATRAPGAGDAAAANA
jgi:sec-independent protein translocase protein TatC